MNVFQNRPLAFSAVLSVLVSVFVSRLKAEYKGFLLCVVCVLFAVLLLRCILRRHFGRHSICALLSLMLSALTLFSSFLYFNVRYASYEKYQDRECRVEGVVLERLQAGSFYSALRVSLSEIEGTPCRADAYLMCEYPTALQVGDCFSMTAVSTVADEENIGMEETELLANGYLLYLISSDASECEIVPHSGERDLRVAASKLNTRLSYLLSRRIGGEEGGLATALLLGNRSFIGEQTELNFRRAGISHLLALSGLHVSILIGFAGWILLKLQIPKLIRSILLLIAAIAYLILTGCSLSTTRAVLMLSLLYLASAWNALYDPFTSICVVLSFILTVSPGAVFDPSLWMSFLAAGSIIVFSPAFQKEEEKVGKKANRTLGMRLKRRMRRAGRMLLVSLAVGTVANLALLLYSAHLFGEISLVSVPATLILSIPVACLLALSALSLCFPMLPLLPELCAWLGRFMLRVADAFSELDHVLLPAVSFPTKLCLTVLTAVLVFLAVANLKSRKWAIPIPCLFLLTLTVTFCMVRFAPPQGPIVVETGHGEVLVYSERGESTVVNHTRGNSSGAYDIQLATLNVHCTEVDHLICARYYNQMTYFISRLAAEVKVRELHLSLPQDEAEKAIAARIRQEAELYGISVCYDAGERMEILEDTFGNQ